MGSGSFLGDRGALGPSLGSSGNVGLPKNPVLGGFCNSQFPLKDEKSGSKTRSRSMEDIPG